MNKLTVIAFGFVILFLAGCSGIKLTPQHVTLMEKIASSETACYKSLAPKYDGLDKHTIALLEQSRQSNRTLLAAIDKDPCRQTNFYDATISVARFQNQAVEKGLGAAGNLGMAFLGADVMKTALQEAGDSYRASEWGNINADKDSGNTFWEDSGNTSNKDSGNTFTTSPIDSNVSTFEQGKQ